MVLPPQRLNTDQIAKALAHNVKRTEGEAKAVATYEATTIRMWCVERAVEAVGTEGVIWTTNEEVGEAQVIKHHSAVVPLAQEILNFVLESPQ